VHRSHDGMSILTNSEDRRLRIFNINSEEGFKLNKLNQIKEGGTIYDYVWYPNTIQKNERINLLVIILI